MVESWVARFADGPYGGQDLEIAGPAITEVGAVIDLGTTEPYRYRLTRDGVWVYDAAFWA